MDFVVLANAWGAGLDNPTSKHQIALELARQGHRVLWVEGAGMRKPSLGSGTDRGRIARKIGAALRGARRVADERIWVLTPLLIPVPSKALIRRVNSCIYFLSSRLWCLLLGFRKPVLINYVPVLSQIERLWRGRRRRAETGKLKAEMGGKRDAPGTTAACPGSTSAFSFQPSALSPVVYHCVDRWDAFDMYDKEMMRRVDEECCRYAGVVVASASDLYDRCKTYNENTHLIRHGVNYEHFAAALGIRRRWEEEKPQMNADERGSAKKEAHSPFSPPVRSEDLPPGPIVGFFGLLSEWVDQDLLVALARELRSPEVGGQRSEVGGEEEDGPSASVVLIGTADVDVSRLEEEPNIHLLGPKPFAELPAYAAWFDVGIIPFVVNELTSAVNPIKLREMIAAGCPVVSTAMREVEVCVEQIDESASGSHLPAVIGHTHEEFIAGNIRTDMFQELLLSDLVVADLSIDNPNVWYELFDPTGATGQTVPVLVTPAIIPGEAIDFGLPLQSFRPVWEPGTKKVFLFRLDGTTPAVESVDLSGVGQ